ncbi:hypothetical protein [Ralstonia sp. ASV6]|uniref:hypothetical protein n=1 Tax=Ralstonia sp. ASV6 TaxID=2795124 RepID=UPI0018EC060E|nr:hypothetical protein [Ralstonia sp. ASV6]
MNPISKEEVLLALAQLGEEATASRTEAVHGALRQGVVLPEDGRGDAVIREVEAARNALLERKAAESAERRRAVDAGAHHAVKEDEAMGISVPVPGAVGFYRPDPSSWKSPSVVLGVTDSRVRVYEAAAEMVFEIDRGDWMSVSEMQADTSDMVSRMRTSQDKDELDFLEKALKGRVSAMRDAIWVAPMVPQILATHGVSAPEVVAESGPELG